MGSKKKVKMRATMRSSYMSVALIVAILVGMLSFKCIDLYRQNLAYEKREAQLLEEKQAAIDRQTEIEDYASYVNTDSFVIEMAREKLGLVFPGETVFREENK